MHYLFLVICLTLFGAVSAEQLSSLPAVEQTLVIVKPEAVANNHVGAILARFEAAGLHITAIKMIHLSKQNAEQFYAVHRERSFFPELTTYMSSGPIVPVVLEGQNAVVKAREIIGATDPKKAASGTIRADFGESVQRNAIHGSDSPENAQKEIEFFFQV